MLIVCVVKIIVFYLPKVVERKQRKFINVITDNIFCSILWIYKWSIFPKDIKIYCHVSGKSLSVNLFCFILHFNAAFIFIVKYSYWFGSDFICEGVHWVIQSDVNISGPLIFFWHNLLSAVWYNQNTVFTIQDYYVISFTCFWNQK